MLIELMKYEKPLKAANMDHKTLSDTFKDRPLKEPFWVREYFSKRYISPEELQILARSRNENEFSYLHTRFLYGYPLYKDAVIDCLGTKEEFMTFIFQKAIADSDFSIASNAEAKINDFLRYGFIFIRKGKYYTYYDKELIE